MSEGWKTVGETLVDILEANDVEVVFGIPGVHTVELYRGLAASPIRHVTPRHEQGAGFMADGYARVSGKPGVCLVITGPGLTNTITAMAQAYQDSVPMLVISGVNSRTSLGHGRGRLHELPDQRGMMATLALMSHTLLDAGDLPQVMDSAFAIMGSARPGPVHIEIPIDVMSERIAPPALRATIAARPSADRETTTLVAAMCRAANRPVILAGGGAVSAQAGLVTLAESIDAPVVTTVNARGLLAGHPLSVPASPSLKSVRDLIADADLVLAFGTQMGQTDYDMYADGGFPELPNLVRVDIDATQLARGPVAAVPVLSSVSNAVTDLVAELGAETMKGEGIARAARARDRAFSELADKIRCEVGILEQIRDTLPGCIIVGDSTQAVYAGNLYYEAGRPRGWFNAATGYGALGYAPPAAIGAAIAEPSSPVVCLTGDGGFQFSLAEIGSAKDAGANVIYLVWNNDGYQEIESYMVDNGIEPEGVKPSAPDFVKIAEAYGLPAERLSDVRHLPEALRKAVRHKGPSLIEIHERNTAGATA
ncbi:5-guanidino-2-oxopentanoate decarboxylase [Rhizobiaceae bacterium n13]|uniref:5-guanidino-2-oxopentanoate decarboxylase n=1 Tax=Ferirhizobium litorale TaxID=2927786 RepID=A0AAE3QFQ9_9HYPH|nr:5-guanidino-2-oxopentanoate decarboxylase [Fererhizobium litorale]MDI7863147.1 5-guanidino-2-oxopentanoate decarboxylase [Fererhizobium litorale]MDI7923175.1 5-guanidino-2-oxopentanoate decarboxylase [Fererhizobium litorale]